MNERAQSYLDFPVKVFILAFAVFLVSYALFKPIFRILDKTSEVFNKASEVMVRVNYLSERFEDAIGEPIGGDNLKMKLYGLTINPATLYQIALLKEQQGDLDGAIREMTLAIGLVEPDVGMYQEKLKELKTLLRVSK